VEDARRRIAKTAGCDPEEIAITRNASESLENAQYGIDLKPGDEVLTTNQDYPRMLTTFRQRERREGIVLKMISFPVPPPSMDDLYQRFERAVTPKTKVILVCHITNRTGQIFPIRKICDMAHARNIAVIVDGAHAFNHFPFNLSELGCDYYGVSLHKWTCAPIGTGFLYVRKSRIASTWSLMASSDRQQDDIRKFEEIGTHPAANHNAISAALIFNENIGIDRKAARLRYLRDRWAHRLAQNPKVKILHSPDPAQSCGIGFLAFNGVNSVKMAETLWSKYNIITVRVGSEEYDGLRITPHIYSTIGDIDYFADSVEKRLRQPRDAESREWYPRNKLDGDPQIDLVGWRRHYLLDGVVRLSTPLPCLSEHGAVRQRCPAYRLPGPRRVGAGASYVSAASAGPLWLALPLRSFLRLAGRRHQLDAGLSSSGPSFRHGPAASHTHSRPVGGAAG
jgi:selenocysteine lyase/cysteine desulfurase